MEIFFPRNFLRAGYQLWLATDFCHLYTVYWQKRTKPASGDAHGIGSVCVCAGEGS